MKNNSHPQLNDFELTIGSLGYRSRSDPTATPSGFLVSGSQNVLINEATDKDGDKVETRAGYQYLGASSTDRNDIVSEFTLKTKAGNTIMGRMDDNGDLEYYSEDSDAWETLLTGLNGSYPLRWTTAHNATELLRILLFVNHSTYLYEWSGAFALWSSDAATTITKAGTTTFAEEGFLSAPTASGDTTTQFDITNTAGNTYRYTFDGTGTDPSISTTTVKIGMYVYFNAQNFAAANNGLFQVTGVGTNYVEVTNAAGTAENNKTIGTGAIYLNVPTIRIKATNGTWQTFTYTGGVATTQLTGVSPSTDSFTFNASSIIVQGVRMRNNTPASGFTNDVIKAVQNHVYIGSHSSSIVYMSKSTDYTAFTFSSPRVPTEGWQFLLDDFCVGFSSNIGGGGLESLVIFAGDDWIYRVEFEQLGDSTIKETAKVKPIIVSSGQGAVVQELISKVQNSIVFINAYNELVELGQFENQSVIQQVPLSDPIKPDFLDADFTGGSIRFWRNNLYVTAGASGRTFILSFREDQKGIRRFWQPPQILPIGQMSDYNGDLIGHSNATTESYKMFTGNSDAGGSDGSSGYPIVFKAHFAYNNFGKREKVKFFDKYFTEIYLTSTAEVVHKILYEYLGAKDIKTFTYKGTDSQHLYTPNPNASLGVNSLGTSPLGGSLSEPENFLKYRRFKPITAQDFFEIQVRYEMETLDGQFQLLCHGPNVKPSQNSPNKIIR